MPDRTYNEALDRALRRRGEDWRLAPLAYANGRTLARKPTRTIPGQPEWIRRRTAADLTPAPRP